MQTKKGKSFIWLAGLIFLTTGFAGVSPGGYEEGDLLNQLKPLFGPLPEVISSAENPVTPEKIHLGKILFYETIISADGTVSCSRCHPLSLYAADGLRKAAGNQCKINLRNSPTVLNAASQISAHWIGNRKSVEDQAKQSVTGPGSFGMPSSEAVEKVLKGIKGYQALFSQAFPEEKEPLTIDNFSKAIGAFERTLITPSAFDIFLKGHMDSFTDPQKRGLKIFTGAGCVGCHSGIFIGGQMYQKFGIIEPYWKYTKSETVDLGRYSVTANEGDQYVFKVPILRNVAKTSPYFHDGSVDRLEDAIWIMGKIQLGRNLTQQEKEDLGEFLRSLTGEIPEEVSRIPLLPSWN